MKKEDWIKELKTRSTKLNEIGTRITRFEQDGDIITRRIFIVNAEGKEELQYESTHSASSLNETREELITYNKNKGNLNETQ